MIDFFADLRNYEFLQYALLTGVLASISCGIVGTFVVVRRITYLAGGIAHSVLGGMGAALYLKKVVHMDFLHPLHGAVAAGLLAAVVIGLVSLRTKEREDTIIGAIWAIGMSVGILFIAKTPGYNQDLMSYLFGNILLVSTRDLWLIAGLDALVVIVSLAFFNQFTAVCLDEQFARLRGLNVEFYYLLLMGLTALTVVLLVTVVGIIMVIALLTIPAAIAGNFTSTLKQMMLLAVGLTVVITSGGLAVSYGPDLPAGATIIALAGALYLIVVVGKILVRSWRG